MSQIINIRFSVFFMTVNVNNSEKIVFKDFCIT